MARRKAPQEFNPNSPDAMFAKILERLKKQDKDTEERHEENKSTLDSILAEAKRTNGRVTRLEGQWKEAFAWLAGASFVLMLLWALFVYLTGH